MAAGRGTCEGIQAQWPEGEGEIGECEVTEAPRRRGAESEQSAEVKMGKEALDVAMTKPGGQGSQSVVDSNI